MIFWAANRPIYTGRSHRRPNMGGAEKMDADAGDTRVTSEMIEAGVQALEDGLLEGYSIVRLRPELVREIYLVMRSRLKAESHVETRHLVGQDAQIADHGG